MKSTYSPRGLRDREVSSGAWPGRILAKIAQREPERSSVERLAGAIGRPVVDDDHLEFLEQNRLASSASRQASSFSLRLCVGMTTLTRRPSQ